MLVQYLIGGAMIASAIKKYVLEEKLSVGHVRAILSIENDEIKELFKRID